MTDDDKTKYRKQARRMVENLLVEAIPKSTAYKVVDKDGKLTVYNSPGDAKEVDGFPVVFAGSKKAAHAYVKKGGVKEALNLNAPVIFDADLDALADKAQLEADAWELGSQGQSDTSADTAARAFSRIARLIRQCSKAVNKELDVLRR